MICAGCGRPLESSFKFCPNCGRIADGSESFGEMLDESFAHLSDAEASTSAERLERMDEDLRALEDELDELVGLGHRSALRRR